jgi:4-hydroxybenzoate polyprenyltransferase
VSISIPSPAAPRRYALIMRHFAATRGLEVSVLQASPLLGAFLASRRHHGASATSLILLLLGSLALTAHVFAFNDWVGYATELRDRRRAAGTSMKREQMGHLAIALLVLANVAFAAIGAWAVLLGAGIAALSLLYSFSPVLGKRTPGAASLNHLLGGALHFLLGYTIVRGLDWRGAALSLFFGLVFTAGHLNQEVRDHDVDRANGIGTTAVVFGCRRAFIASLCLFTAAYLLIVGLAAAGVLPQIMLLSAAAWLLQARWSLQALRRGPTLETALWMQRRYRLLFAVVGLAMLL